MCRVDHEIRPRRSERLEFTRCDEAFQPIHVTYLLVFGAGRIAYSPPMLDFCALQEHAVGSICVTSKTLADDLSEPGFPENIIRMGNDDSSPGGAGSVQKR